MSGSTFSTRKEAVAWLAQTTVEIRQGVHCPAHRSPTVLEAGEQWIVQAETDGLERASVNSPATPLATRTVTSSNATSRAAAAAPRRSIAIRTTRATRASPCTLTKGGTRALRDLRASRRPARDVSDLSDEEVRKIDLASAMF